MSQTEVLVQVAPASPSLRLNPPALSSTVSFRAGRSSIVGPAIPEPPFPIYLSGAVQRGYGRGGKDLGCPTANLPDESTKAMAAVAKKGVYYGYAKVYPLPGQDSTVCADDCEVHPMAMSMGYNPFYGNTELTAASPLDTRNCGRSRLGQEIHIMHPYKTDFYGHKMKTIVLGYIRDELDYTSREDLIEDIETDKRVAINGLKRPEYEKFARDQFFS